MFDNFKTEMQQTARKPFFPISFPHFQRLIKQRHTWLKGNEAFISYISYTRGTTRHYGYPRPTDSRYDNHSPSGGVLINSSKRKNWTNINQHSKLVFFSLSLSFFLFISRKSHSMRLYSKSRWRKKWIWRRRSRGWSVQNEI